MKQSLPRVGERFLDKKHLLSISYHWHLTSSSVCSFYYLMIGCLLSVVSWVHVCHLFSLSLCSQCWFILCEEKSGQLIFLIIFISILQGSHVALAANFYLEQAWLISRRLFVNLLYIYDYSITSLFNCSIISLKHCSFLSRR